jgi:hypothetical protein
MTKSILLVVVAAALVAGCSQVLGFKDPTLEDTGDDAPQDAKIGGPGDDGGPMTDAAEPIDAAPGCPSTCTFGCDPGSTTCKTGQLYVYETVGAFGANAFGGQDVPATVRATADNLCFMTAADSFPARQCSRDRTHAVLSITSLDNTTTMASQFSIPVDVGVSRAEDGVLVENNWNDLIDLTKVPRAAITTATGDQALVWTGASSNVSPTTTCQAWTSAANANQGLTGHTDLTTAPNWLGRGGTKCDLLAHLLCICWTGGN